MPSPDFRRGLELLPESTLVTLSAGELLALLEEESEPPIADLTVEEVAEAFGRAASTVRTWCASGALPGAYRLRGREWRIPRTAIEAQRARERGETPRAGAPVADLSAWRRAGDGET